MIRNLTTSAISYGATFPFGPPQADGILFFKTAADPNGANPIGLYVYSFQDDYNSNVIGNQVGSGWKTAVDVSAFLSRFGDEMSGSLKVGGFNGVGGLRTTISTTANPGSLDFLNGVGDVIGSAGWSVSTSKLQLSGNWNFENLPTVSGGALIWTSLNDGAGSGLDADVLDGQHGTYYLNLANSTGSIDLTSKTTGTLPITRGGTGATTSASAPFALKGANTDIISLNSPSLGNATAITQALGTTTNVVATCEFVQNTLEAGSMVAVLVPGTAQTALSNKHYILINNGPTTVTLPANPNAGDRVRVSPMNGLLSNVINRNGKTIMNGTNDLILNNLNVTVELMYNNSTWYVTDGVMVSGGGGGGGSGSYNASQIVFTPVGGISAINVQLGMAELDTEKASLVQLAANTGSNLIGYSGGGNTVIRTVQSKLRDVVSVFDYMTQAQINDVKAGTLLVDVTTPILAAIADVQATGGGILYFPPGKYKITQNLSVTWANSLERLEPAGKVVLRGAGSSMTVFMDYRTSVGAGACINYDFSASGEAGIDTHILTTWTGGFSIIRAINPTTVVDGVYTVMGTGTGFAANFVWGGRYHDIAVSGYNTNLSFLDCTAFSIDKVFSAKCNVGLYMSKNTYAVVTGASITNLTVSECKTWGVKTINGSFEVNSSRIINCGYMGITSGGILYQATANDIPIKGIDVSNVHFQNNAGTADISIDIPVGAVLNNSTNITSCSFYRTSSDIFTNHNISVSATGLTIMNLNVRDCGFASAGTYVADISRKYIDLSGSIDNINPIYIGNRYGHPDEVPDTDDTKFLRNDGVWAAPSASGAAVGTLNQVLTNSGLAPTKTAQIAQLQITDPALYIKKHSLGMFMDFSGVFSAVPGQGIAPNTNNVASLGGNLLRWTTTYSMNYNVGSDQAKIHTGSADLVPSQATHPDKNKWININDAAIFISPSLTSTPGVGGIIPARNGLWFGSDVYKWNEGHFNNLFSYGPIVWNGITIAAPTGDTTKFLRNDGTWTTLTGGGVATLDQVLSNGNISGQTATFGRVQFNNSNVYIEKNINGNFLDLAGTAIVSPGQGISPSSTISLDIGSAMYRWKAIYTNALDVGAGFKFGSVNISAPYGGATNFLKADGTWGPSTGTTPNLNSVLSVGNSSALGINIGGVGIGSQSITQEFVPTTTIPYLAFNQTVGVIAGKGIMPVADGGQSCGAGGARWSVVYSFTPTINTSDARDKENIQPSSLGLNFINELTPVSYTWKKQSEHTKGEFFGLIAQDVKEVSEKHGVKDFAGWISDDKDDPDSRQGLRYTELIAPLIKAVQELSEQNKELLHRIKVLEGK